MLRHWASGRRDTAVRLIYSSRTLEDVIYRQELEDVIYRQELEDVIYRQELESLAGKDGADVRLALTRRWPEDWAGHRGRIDRSWLEQVAWAADEEPLINVCGPTSFVEAVAEALVSLGHAARRIMTERFGPTGN